MAGRKKHGAALTDKLSGSRVFCLPVVPMGQADIVTPAHIVAKQAMGTPMTARLPDISTKTEGLLGSVSSRS